MTKVKICGLTRETDVVAACELGAAVLGFNFVAASPRRITVSRALEIGAAVPAGVLRAGVFAEAGPVEIARAVAAACLDIAQIHRRVTSEDVAGLEGRIVPAVRVQEGCNGLPDAGLLARCRALLWDSSEGQGRFADWGAIEDASPLPVPVYVAGGLDPDNVGGVIRRLRPAGVDVASGVESAPGVKDRTRLERFFEAVREADRG